MSARPLRIMAFGHEPISERARRPHHRTLNRRQVRGIRHRLPRPQEATLHRVAECRRQGRVAQGYGQRLRKHARSVRVKPRLRNQAHGRTSTRRPKLQLLDVGIVLVRPNEWVAPGGRLIRPHSLRRRDRPSLSRFHLNRQRPPYPFRLRLHRSQPRRPIAPPIRPRVKVDGSGTVTGLSRNA